MPTRYIPTRDGDNDDDDDNRRGCHDRYRNKDLLAARRCDSGCGCVSRREIYLFHERSIHTYTRRAGMWNFCVRCARTRKRDPAPRKSPRRASSMLNFQGAYSRINASRMESSIRQFFGSSTRADDAEATAAAGVWSPDYGNARLLSIGKLIIPDRGGPTGRKPRNFHTPSPPPPADSVAESSLCPSLPPAGEHPSRLVLPARHKRDAT